MRKKIQMLKIIRKGNERYICQTCHFGPRSSKNNTFELKVTESNNSIQRLGRASAHGKMVSEEFLHHGKNML